MTTAEDIKKEIADLKYERVKVELNAIASVDDIHTYTDSDEVALQELDDAINTLEEKLSDLLEDVEDAET
jgi:hypothetical protein